MEIKLSCIKCGGREFCVSLLTSPSFRGIILLRCNNCGRKTLYKVIEDETASLIPEKENAFITIYKGLRRRGKRKEKRLKRNLKRYSN
jgi:uncharacterized Zn finger protein